MGRMTDRTNLKRQREQIERERAVGIIRVTVRIPEERRDELRRLVESWRASDAPKHCGT
jgi:vacuolar-type H+-ATPase subunit F/Vma7